MADATHRSSVELRDVLCASAARLIDRASWSDGRVAWPTPALHADPQAATGWAWHVEPEPTPWLYDGLAGIARGLALAAPVVRQTQSALATRMREVAFAALRGALAALDTDSGDAGNAGLYDGAMGVACVAVELGRLWGDRECEASGLRLARRVLRAMSSAPPPSWDLVSGRAGLVCGAGWLAGWTRTADTAWRVHRALLPAAGPAVPDGLGPGLAHGLAGLAVALAHAWRLDRDDRTLARVAAVEARENDWYSAEHGGWPDGRAPDQHPAWWCHGATGIGFARQRVTALTGVPSGDVRMAREAVHREMARGALTHEDWSLCHGLAGAVAFLLTGPDPRHAADDEVIARRLLLEGSREAATRGAWPGGAPVPAAQSGVMTGEAGVLLVLARAVIGDAATPWPLWL